MNKATMLLAGLFFVIACVHEPFEGDWDSILKESLVRSSPNGDLSGYVLPQSDDLANIPNQDKKNPLTPAKIELGRMLFHETGLAKLPKNSGLLNTYSCASCHVASQGFTAGRFQGIADGAIGFGEHGEERRLHPFYQGEDVDAQGARPLTMQNLAYVTNALWAGTFGSFGTNVGTESVWNQDTLVKVNHKGLEGLEANNFRALQVHRMFMDKKIAEELGYTAMFDAAFPDFPENERYDLMRVSFAIAAYQRSITTTEAPFQKYLRGEKEAMTKSQKQGAALFFGKAGCINCHQGPALNKMEFQAVGVNDLYDLPELTFRTGPSDKRNFGRGGFTGRVEDNFKFKIPQLYNLKNVGFYFHGASKRSLREVVQYFNDGVAENERVPPSHISTFFRPLDLTEKEIDALTDFLENGLYDPTMDRFLPASTMSGFCFPNNDSFSQEDMGCH